MALPAFFARVADSLRPVAEVDPDVLRDKLDNLHVRIELATADPAAQSAFMLASNLAARLYPSIELAPSAQVPDPAKLVAQARELILAINPVADVEPAAKPAQATASRPPSQGRQPRTVRLRIGISTPDADDVLSGHHENEVVVDAHGWHVLVDPDETKPVDSPGHLLTWLAAAAIGMAEVFRCVFTDELGELGRSALQPGGFNLLTSRPLDATTSALVDSTGPTSGELVDIGDVHLIGAGAIGQATAYALARLNVAGRIQVIDPETVTLSNLQRYLLTDANSVGAVKVNLVRDVLRHQAPANRNPTGDNPSDNALEVHPFQGRWGDLPTHLRVDQVLVALDTARDRIAVAGTLPYHAYNAWTQVADLGWSRHEQFGDEPCLACLYYPDRALPSEHELISQALQQPLLRVLAYLIYNVPIGYPLPGIPALAELPPPEGSERWTQVGLLEDLVTAGIVSDDERVTWSTSSIGILYRDGICAGGLLPVGDLPGDVLVPLAHQSALAGIMLAAELIWSRTPDFADQRDTIIEHRYDVLRGFPQVVARPRQRTPHCLCTDPFYLAPSAAPPEPEARTF